MRKRRMDWARAARLAAGGLGLAGVLWAEKPAGSASQSEVVRVGTYENPPRVLTGADGNVTGFIPAILEHIAQKEHWRIEYRHGTWQQGLDRLAGGQIDLLMDTVVSPERQMLFDFNQETVLITWAAVYTRPDLKVQSLFDLAGRRIALLKGGIYSVGSASLQDLLNRLGIRAVYVDFPSYAEVFQALAAHTVDAGVVTNTFGTYFEEEYRVARSPIVFSPSELRFAFRKNSAAGKRWARLLDARLHALKADSNSFYYEAVDTYLNRPSEGPAGPAEWKTALSPEDRMWIEKHPVIRLGIDPEFHPFEFRDAKGEYRGIASDYIRLLNQRLELNLQVQNGLSWTEAVDGMKAGRIDVLPCVGVTAERSKFVTFTRPYARFQRVIFTQANRPALSGVKSLEPLKVGVQAGSSHEGFLREHSAIKPAAYKTLEECLVALSVGKIEAVVTNLASGAYWIRQLNLTNLKVAGPVSSELSTLHFAVRKDWPELVSILNKGLNRVTLEEQRRIERLWVSVEYKTGIEPRVAWRIARRIAAGVLVVLGAILIWNYRLKKEITRKQEIERILAAAKDRAESADRVKSAFLATMSHELRTPLNSIIGFTGLLLQGLAGPMNAEQTKQLRMVKASGEHLLALINDVLDISKIEAGQFQVARAPVNVPESIQKAVQTVTPLAEKKHLPLVTRISPEVGSITSDRRRLEQILLNLLSNAIKFTEQGRVTLSAEIVRDGAGNPTLCISVTDTGPGIRPEDLSRLFQPFGQLETGLGRTHEGTGLGLAISRRLAEHLGGTIAVESEWGRGTTFRVTLPAPLEAPPEQAAAAATPASAAPANGGQREGRPA